MTKESRFDHPIFSEELHSYLSQLSLYDLLSFDGKTIIQEVEYQIEKQFETRNALLVNSGTSALYASYFAAGVTPGSEVIVPGYTFYATATPLLRIGARPVLADVDDNGNILPKSIEEHLSPNTSAIVVTHLWGIPADIEAIVAIAKRNNIQLIEDASHAHGATYRNKVVGTFGDFGAWSLGAKKILTGGQGGLLVAKKYENYVKARLVTRSNERLDAFNAQPSLENLRVAGLGMNLRIHPYSAAAIGHQVQYLTNHLQQRRDSVNQLHADLIEIDELSLPEENHLINPAWYALPIKVKRGKEFRDRLLTEYSKLGGTGIDAPGSTSPLTEFPQFIYAHSLKGELGEKISTAESLPRAYDYHNRIIKLTPPVGVAAHEVTTRISRTLKQAVQNVIKEVN